MLFNISPQNAEKAKRAFTTTRPAHVYGYTKSAILTPKNHRLKYCYQIDTMHDIIVCTIRHMETDTMEAVAVFRNFTPESIEIEKADLYRNCSNYPYRTETADRYMRKYDQIACIVHGAISAGLLYDTQEATTSAETIEDKEITTKDENRPQEAAETATEPTLYKYGMRLRGYSIGAQPAGVVSREDDHTGAYYDIIVYNAPLSQEDIKHYSLTPLEGPTTAATTPDAETTAAAETEPQETTSDDGSNITCPAAGSSITPATGSWKSITTTTEGTQEATQTDRTSEGAETTTPERQRAYSATGGKTITDGTTPASDTRQPDGNTITGGSTPDGGKTITGDTDGGNRITSRNRITPPGHTCENAPGRTETPQAVQTTTPPHKRPPRAKTRDGRRTSRGSPDRRKCTFSGRMSKRVHIYRSILWVPIFNQDF